MDEIKNYIHKNRLRWFGHDADGRRGNTKKILHTKMEGKQPRGRPRTRWIDQIRKDLKMRGKIMGKNARKQKVGE